MDIKMVFPHNGLNEEVYVQQPKGYVKKGKEKFVWELRKSLYGLRQGNGTISVNNLWFLKAISVVRQTFACTLDKLKMVAC